MLTHRGERLWRLGETWKIITCFLYTQVCKTIVIIIQSLECCRELIIKFYNFAKWKQQILAVFLNKSTIFFNYLTSTFTFKIQVDQVDKARNVRQISPQIDMPFYNTQFPIIRFQDAYSEVVRDISFST